MDEQSEKIKTEASELEGEHEKQPEKVPQEGKKQNPFLAFFYDILRGIGIGIAFIIPGFSGGSVAAILGIYERLVGAIADIFKHFKTIFIIFSFYPRYFHKKSPNNIY